MEDSLVSIIITLYNKSSYIEEAILSVSQQTYKNWELIIVDDCSTDWSFEIAKKFCSNLWIEDKCIFVKNEKNSWVGKTFENWLKISKGEWIAMCDWDDILMKNKIEENLKFCEKNNLDFCYWWYVRIDENNNVISNSKIYNIVQTVWRIIEKFGKTRKRLILPWAIWSSIFFKKERNWLDFPDDIYQDLWMETYYNQLWYKIGEMNKNLYFYRMCRWAITDYNSIIDRYLKLLTVRVRMEDYIIKEKIWDIKRVSWLKVSDQFILKYIKDFKESSKKINFVQKIWKYNKWLKNIFKIKSLWLIYKLILIAEMTIIFLK